MRAFIRAAAAAIACCALASPAAAEPTAGDAMLTAETLGEIVGVALTEQLSDSDAPSDAQEVTPASCWTISNSTTADALGDGWISYQNTSYGDGVPEAGDHQFLHTISHTAIAYPDPQRAAAALAALAEGLRGCGNQLYVRHKPTGDDPWRQLPGASANGRLHWSSVQESYNPWRCALAAQRNDRVVLETTLCQFASPAQTPAMDEKLDRVLDRMAERVR